MQTGSDTPRTISRLAERGITEVLNFQDFRCKGRADIYIREYLRELGREACRDRDFILTSEEGTRFLNQYLEQNPSILLAIGLIFQLKVGLNFTNECLFMRHLRADAKCPGCNNSTEDVKHLIEHCPRYETLRKRLREVLEGTGLEASRLVDVALYNDTTCKAWRNMEECVRKRKDKYIKNFIEIYLRQGKDW